MKKVISLVLSLVLLAALAVPAFAADETNVEQYGTLDPQSGKCGYLAIGDSISRGMGATADYKERYENYDCRNVINSFTYNIAKAIGCVMPDDIADPSGTYWPCCYPGESLASLMDLMGIEDNFYDADYVHNTTAWRRYYGGMLPYFRGEQSIGGDGENGLVGNILDFVNRARLITVEIGMGDILNRPIQLATTGSFLIEGESFSIDSPEDLVKFVDTIVTALWDGFDYWSHNYPMFIRELRKMNPDATIVMIGSFNQVADVELLDQTLLPIGTAFTAISAAMNAYYRQWEKELDVPFVDISNAESGSTQYDWSLLGEFFSNEEVATHPTPEGYQYITRQVLAVLQTKEPSDPAPLTTNIRVDLGNFTEADHVLLDGVPITNYSMNGTILTVPCCHKLAKSVTVMVKGKDGGLDMKTYQLIWHEKTGYTAYRMYGKNGVLPVTTKLAETVRSAWTKTLDITVGSLKNIFRGGIFRLVK